MTIEIYDIHPHIISRDAVRYPPAPFQGRQSEYSSKRPLTFEQMVAQMDAAGVQKAAIVQASTLYGYDNSYLADCIATMPGRFTGVGAIDLLAHDAVAVLEKWMRRGITGLRLYTRGARAPGDAGLLDDPRSFPVWDFATAHKLPITMQTTSAAFPQVRNLLERFPEVPTMLCHCAKPQLEDGPPYSAARPLFDLASYPNLYLKVTPRVFEPAQRGKATPESFFQALVSAFGSRRIAFGSNIPSTEGTVSDSVALAQRCLASLPESDRAMIFSGTAKRLYPALAS